jgi:hypothetical protein
MRAGGSLVRPTARTCGFVQSLVFAAVAGLDAQVEEQSPAEWYGAYRAAFVKALTLDDVEPYLARDTRESVRQLSPEDRTRMFDLLKIMSLMRDLTIRSEAPEGERHHVLAVEAREPEGTHYEALVLMTLEDGAWKVVREAWRPK